MAGHGFALECSWRVAMHDLGVRPADVLRRAQLPEDALTRTELRLSTEAYFRFWSSLEAEVDDPLFPIRIVEAATAETFVPAIFAVVCSPNLAIGLERLAKYKRLIAPMALDLKSSKDTFSVSIRWLDAKVDPPPSLGAMELAFIVNLARMGTRERIQPLKARAPKPPKPGAAYRKYLGVDVARGKHVELVFSRADAQLPFLTANDLVWKAFEPQLRRRLAELDEAASVRERVRSALLESLPSGQASVALVAARLAMSKRTLQRRLSAEETTFLEVLTSTRLELARHYLNRTALSCAEISFLLGFEDPNSFYRAYHDWTGTTPQRARLAMH